MVGLAGALGWTADRRSERYHRRSVYLLLVGAALAAVGALLYVAFTERLATAGFVLAAGGATVVVAQVALLVTAVPPPGHGTGPRRYSRVGVLLATIVVVAWMLPRAVDLPESGEAFAMAVTVGLSTVTALELLRRLRAGGHLPAAAGPPQPPVGGHDDDAEEPPSDRTSEAPGEPTDEDDPEWTPGEEWGVPPGEGSVPPGSVGRDLQTVHGIGPEIAEKLEGGGIDDVADLLSTDPEALAEAVHGISAEQLREWQRAATEE